MGARKPLPWWATVLIVLVAVGLMFWPGQGHRAESVGSRLFAPVQLGLSGILDQVVDFVGTLQKIRVLADENEQLSEQVDRLGAEIVRLQELEQENQDLRHLLGLQQRNPAMQLLPVRVIGRDPSPFARGIVIDRGTGDGVQVDMVVITWRGLVGRVIQAEPTSSRVLLLTDVNSSVSARIQDPASRATGIVRGTADGALLMQHVPQQDTVVTDQLVITSGYGGIYPEGLVVGRVMQVRRKDVDVFQEAIVEPAVDMNKLERLYVIAAPVASDSK